MKQRGELTVDGSSVVVEARIAKVLHESPGRLGSSIRRVELADSRTAWLKVAELDSPEPLEREQRLLRWLKGRVPSPSVLSWKRATRELLLSELPGVAMHEPGTEHREVALQVLASTLRAIHSIDPTGCPTRRDPAKEAKEAKRLFESGRVDMAAFAAESGCQPQEALRFVFISLERCADEFIEVLVHGDYCLPNVLVHGSELGGVVDWGLGGVGDPCIDLALVEGSLRFNWGEDAVRAFYRHYGPRPAAERIELFRLLDQFFTHAQVDPTL